LLSEYFEAGMPLCVSLCSKVIVIVATALLIAVTVTFIALGASGVFSATSSSSPATPTTTPSSSTFVSVLNDVSLFPNGTYSALLSSFTQAPTTFALIPFNQTILNQTGAIDNSSSVFEAGRLQYLYFHLPAVSGPSVVSGIALHFDTSGRNDNLVVVPLFTSGWSSGQNSGVGFLQAMPDGSSIVRVEMTVLSSVCSTNNISTRDGCFTAVYQARAVVNRTQITSFISAEFYVACGDVCLLASSMCSASCTTCDGQQIAGANTPVSRRYNMGSSSATFKFDYDTYSVKDRVTIWNGATLLFDSECVGEFQSVNVTYSSTSPTIRVDVEPNCSCINGVGCSGTAWNFRVHCLNETSGQRSFIGQKTNVTVVEVGLLSDKI
jgi:hypothetical protein